MTPELIEQMNAHGPYDHGVWRMQEEKGDVVFGTDSLFTSRAEKMVEAIVLHLRKSFSDEELSALSIMDIGCYDGWVLTQICEKIKFKRAIGVEPRQKNIAKGEFARGVAGKSTDCNFIVGGFENLTELFPEEIFDVVLCLGMLHHTKSIEDAIKKIASKCRRLLIVDSMVIPELSADKEKILQVVNPVDIVYRNKEKTWAVAAYKYESSYFDGSASNASIVNIPQIKLIQMCLSLEGFPLTQQLMSELDFYPKEYQSLRGVNEIMLAANRDPNHDSTKQGWKQDAIDYEYLYTCRAPLVGFLLSLYSQYKENAEIANLFRLVLQEAELSQKQTVIYKRDADDDELAGAISRAPYEKIAIELAKHCVQNKDFESAKSILLLVTRKVNSDWRSFYRACFLLSRINQKMSLNVESETFKNLLVISNPQFPAMELDELWKY
jgi:2-polyprenyl-3-methyl-5-hydroxy-6-metoxy-1,4-benzoquinol methylase